MLAPRNPQELLIELEPLLRRTLDRHYEQSAVWFPHEYVPYVSFLDDVEIGLLYNTFIEKTGVSVQQQRQGQGEQWRDHWGWLSAPLGAREMLVSVRLTAQLMRCQPLLSGLLEVMHQPNETLRRLALCVIRRWLLTLKALAWLEKALSHPWIEVRPQDLACIAFNSVRPGWPRGLVAISHRSAEVKPTSQEMRIWKSAAGIIDATYVPAWETNTGMIWGLFSTAPLIARVSSPRYADSIWCKRESELVQYLLEDCDYLSNRYVVDLRPDELRELDGLI